MFNHFSTKGSCSGPAHYDVSIRQAFVTSSFKIFLTQTFPRCGATCYVLPSRAMTQLFNGVNFLYLVFHVFASHSLSPGSHTSPARTRRLCCMMYVLLLLYGLCFVIAVWCMCCCCCMVYVLLMYGVCVFAIGSRRWRPIITLRAVSGTLTPSSSPSSIQPGTHTTHSSYQVRYTSIK